MTTTDRIAFLAAAVREVAKSRGHLTKRQAVALADDLADAYAALCHEANLAAEAVWHQRSDAA